MLCRDMAPDVLWPTLEVLLDVDKDMVLDQVIFTAEHPAELGEIPFARGSCKDASNISKVGHGALVGFLE